MKLKLKLVSSMTPRVQIRLGALFVLAGLLLLFVGDKRWWSSVVVGLMSMLIGVIQRRRRTSEAAVLQSRGRRFRWKRVLVGCAVVAGLAVLGVGMLIWYTNQDPPGMELTVTSGQDVAVGAEFDLVVKVRNGRASEAVALTDIDIAEEFLRGFAVVTTEPAPQSSTTMSFRATTRGQSFTFGVNIPPGETRSFRFRLRAQRAGTFHGDVDAWEGWRYLTQVAETTVLRRPRPARR